jgi:predicted site-specific integrase-resolvase
MRHAERNDLTFYAGTEAEQRHFRETRMLVGYARVSTTDQKLDLQIDALEGLPVSIRVMSMPTKPVAPVTIGPGWRRH